MSVTQFHFNGFGATRGGKRKAPHSIYPVLMLEVYRLDRGDRRTFIRRYYFELLSENGTRVDSKTLENRLRRVCQGMLLPNHTISLSEATVVHSLCSRYYYHLDPGYTKADPKVINESRQNTFEQNGILYMVGRDERIYRRHPDPRYQEPIPSIRNVSFLEELPHL